MGNQDLIQILVIVGCVFLLLYLIKTQYYDVQEAENTTPAGSQSSRPEAFSDPDSEEPFYNYDVASPVEEQAVESAETTQALQEQERHPQPAEALGSNEEPRAVGDMNEASNVGGHYLPNQCFPKDVLSASDLLPKDADSKWAQVNPAGQGALTDQNFLTAGFHTGINTVGSTNRNANYQLRSDPPNPQVKVSPWNQTTIEPDTMRRPMEIGGY